MIRSGHRLQGYQVRPTMSSSLQRQLHVDHPGKSTVGVHSSHPAPPLVAEAANKLYTAVAEQRRKHLKDVDAEEEKQPAIAAASAPNTPQKQPKSRSAAPKEAPTQVLSKSTKPLTRPRHHSPTLYCKDSMLRTALTVPAVRKIAGQAATCERRSEQHPARCFERRIRAF